MDKEELKEALRNDELLSVLENDQLRVSYFYIHWRFLLNFIFKLETTRSWSGI
jgi:hypothetical protein